MIDLKRDGNIFTLTMNAGENRWNTSFVRGFAEALDEIEASEGPAVVVTTSSDGKFFEWTSAWWPDSSTTCPR